jgi:hypothetical protein
LFTLLNPRQTGISFTNEIHEDENRNVLAYEYFYNGGGVAIGDINNDGLPDIFFTSNLHSNKLYLNEGGMHFRDITKQAGLKGRNDWKTGVTMADVNGDGWLDIYVCYSGKGSPDSRSNELYINNQNNTFTESAAGYGLDDKGCSTQAAFFDYDLDGDLDCYVLNHNNKAYKNVNLHYLKNDYDSLAGDHLYRNESGHFHDVSHEAGITGNPISFGLGIAVSDINNDGWPDLYISNDYMEQDYLYINNKRGGFTQQEFNAFGHQSQFSMGSAVADVNNDGLVDILTLDMLPEDNHRQKLLQAQENYELYQNMSLNGFHFQFMRNMLHLNNGNGTFSEIGQLAGLSNTDWSWSPLVADFDNDGYKDVVITNGYMRDYTNKDFLKFWGDYLVKQAVNRDSVNYLEIVKMMPSTNIANYAYRNLGNLQFQNVSVEWGLKQYSLSNGAAYGDLDRDGDLDIVVNNINEPAFILQNQSTGTHFLDVQLKGKPGNAFGIGARIWCYSGSNCQYLEQIPTRGYQSSVSEILHFGTGQFTTIDSLRVQWQDGTQEVITDVKAVQRLLIDQTKARAVLPVRTDHNPLFKKVDPLVPYAHLQLEYNDFKRQPLLPVMLSQVGPKMAVADVNGDGLDDLFIGSAQGQSSQLYMQTKEGFRLSEQDDFLADSVSVTSSILFFDADGDGDADLYCASGGYNDFTEADARLQDRLFMNDGTGHFSRAINHLPALLTSKSVVCVSDYDKDGDMDLFVGGRVVPGMYPSNPPSFLLQNDGKGYFSDVTASNANSLQHPGMVTDALWLDWNQDGEKDLIITGEWMAPTVFVNHSGHLERAQIESLSKATGWWNSLLFTDADKDGNPDLIAGNWGLNSQLKCNLNEPLKMIYSDFDDNGSIDPFLCCYIQGISYPYVSRDELLDEIYSMRRKFPSYASYADATMDQIFSGKELHTAQTLEANELATCYFKNTQGTFNKSELPIEVQFSPVYKIISEDLNADGYQDLLLFGNNEYPRLKLGKMDASFGMILLNDGKGNFKYQKYTEHGLAVAGDVKDAVFLNYKGDRYLILGINNSELVTFKMLR